MKIFVVNSRLLKSKGVYYNRGTIVTSSQIKDMAYKVANGDILKIEYPSKAGLRLIQRYKMRTGIDLKVKIEDYINNLNELKQLENTAGTETPAVKVETPVDAKGDVVVKAPAAEPQTAQVKAVPAQKIAKPVAKATKTKVAVNKAVK